MDNGGLRYGAMESARRPPLPTATRAFEDIQILIRLFEVLLHGGPQIGGWTARQMHQAVLDTFDLSEKTYRLNQLRYDASSRDTA